MIISILEPLPTHIVTSPLTSLCSFCNSRFELLILATEPVSNTQGLLWTLVKYTSIICISKYTFVHFAILLIRQVSRAVPLPVTISFAVEALVSGLSLALGFFTGVTTCLSFFLKFPFYPFALYLKQVVWLTINTWCSFLISTFADFSIVKSSGITFVIPCIL